AGFITFFQHSVLKKILRRQMRNGGRAFALQLAQVPALGEDLLERFAESAKIQFTTLKQQYDENRQKAEVRYRPHLEQFERRIRTQRQAIEQKHRSDQERIQQQGTAAIDQSKQQYEKARSECVARAE